MAYERIGGGRLAYRIQFPATGFPDKLSKDHRSLTIKGYTAGEVKAGHFHIFSVYSPDKCILHFSKELL